MTRSIGLAVLFSLTLVSTAAASATLHIGTGAGTPCAVGCGGDPNVITSNQLSIYQNSNGASDLLTPLLLILGIPNATGLTPAPAIASIQEYDPYAGTLVGATTSSFGNGGTPLYGWSGNGFAGSWTSSSPQVYEFLGLTLPNITASNNSTNWFGVAPTGTTSFGLFVYIINGSLGNNGLFDVTWAGSGLPGGTIAIAYACTGALQADGHCTSSYGTPFTESGFVVPEPPSVGLLAFGLMGLLAAARVRRQRRPTVI